MTSGWQRERPALAESQHECPSATVHDRLPSASPRQLPSEQNMNTNGMRPIDPSRLHS
jgi:hypothetical protein